MAHLSDSQRRPLMRVFVRTHARPGGENVNKIWSWQMTLCTGMNSTFGKGEVSLPVVCCLYLSASILGEHYEGSLLWSDELGEYKNLLLGSFGRDGFMHRSLVLCSRYSNQATTIHVRISSTRKDAGCCAISHFRR